MLIAMLWATVVLQAAAAVAAARLFASRRSLLWFAVTAAMALLTAERTHSLLEHAPGAPVDLAEVVVRVITSLLICVALWQMTRRARGWTADPSPPSGSARLERAASVFIIASMVLIAMVSFGAYETTKGMVRGAVLEGERAFARLFVSGIDAGAGDIDDAEAYRRITAAWSQVSTESEYYLCLVGADGRLRLNTANRGAEGRDVSGQRLGRDGSSHTLGDLLRQRGRWAGESHNLAGEPQLVAYAYSPRLESLVGIHMTAAGIHQRVLKASTPWLLGLLLVMLMVVVSGGMMHLAYHREIAATRRERDQRQQLADRRQRQADNLAHIIDIADELMACEDEDAVHRRAVELACQRLCLERCWLWLHDGGAFRGTYGCDVSGTVVDAREQQFERPPFPLLERVEQSSRGRARWGAEEECELLTLTPEGWRPLGCGWVAVTEVRSGESLIGVLVNDAAYTSAPLDEDAQDTIAVFCSLLGAILERKRAEQSVQRLLAQSELRRRISVRFLMCETPAELAEAWQHAVGELRQAGIPALTTSVQTPADVSTQLASYTPHNGFAAPAQTLSLQSRPWVGRAWSTGEMVEVTPDRFPESEAMFSKSPRTGVVFEVPAPGLGSVGIACETRCPRTSVTLTAVRETAELLGHAFRRIHEALARKESEQRLRTVVENMPVMLDAFDEEGNIVLWNYECERVTGYKAEEIVGRPEAMELLYPDSDYREQIMAAWARRGNDYLNWEWVVQAKDGSPRTVAWSNISDRFPIPGWATWGVGIDVTERVAAQAEQTRLVRLMEQLLATTLDGFILADDEGRIRDVNPAYCQMTGYTRDELLQMNIRQVEAALTPEQFEERIARTVSAGGARFTTRHRRKDGSIIDLDVSIAILRVPEGVRVAAFVRDITEQEARRRREQHLVRGLRRVVTASQELLGCPDLDSVYRRAVELARESFDVDRVGLYIVQGDRLFATFGTGPDGQTVDERGHLSGWRVSDVAVLQSPPATDRPSWRVQEDAAWSWVDRDVDRYIGRGAVVSTPLWSRDQPIGVLYNDNALSGRDIDPVQQDLLAVYGSVLARIIERKQAEERLRASEAFSSALARLAPVGIFRSDAQGACTWVNDRVPAIVGRSKAECMGSGWTEALHPEDVGWVAEHWQRAVTSRAGFDGEMRWLHPDGAVRWTLAEGLPMFDEQGELEGCVGVLVDITERRHAEERLRFQAAVLEHVRDIVHVTDAERRITYWNRGAEEALGYREAEMLGRDPHELHAVDEVRDAAEETAPGHLPVRAREGDIVWLDMRSSAMQGPDGAITGYLTVARDVTARRAAEQGRQALARRLSAIQEIQRTALTTADLETVAAVAVEEVSSLLPCAQVSVVAVRGGAEAGDVVRTLTRDTGTPEPGPRWSLSQLEPDMVAALQEGRPWLITNLDAVQDRCPLYQWLVGQGHRAIYMVPLYVYGELAGTLAVSRDADDPDFTQPELTACCEIADALAVALHHAQLTASVQRQSEELRLLSARLADAEDRERAAMARELHDTVGRNVTAIGINLGLIRGILGPAAPVPVQRRLDDTQELLEELTARVRDVMGSLRPSMLDDYGVAAAIRIHAAREQERTGVEVIVRGPQLGPQMDPGAEMALLRIAQEAIHNAIVHARPARVEVEVAEDEEAVTLRVQDDGVGFALRDLAPPSDEGGWGLLTMRQRATGAGGRLVVDSTPGNGTRIIAIIPR